MSKGLTVGHIRENIADDAVFRKIDVDDLRIRLDDILRELLKFVRLAVLQDKHGVNGTEVLRQRLEKQRDLLRNIVTVKL